MEFRRTSADFRRETKQYEIAIRAERGLTQAECYGELRPMVLVQSPHWMIFTANPRVPGGHREAKPISVQIQMLKDQIGRTYNAMGRARSSRFDDSGTDTDYSDFTDSGTETETEETEGAETSETQTDSDGTETEGTETPSGERDNRNMIQRGEDFLSRLNRLRDYLRRQANDPQTAGSALDKLDSMRPVKYGLRLIASGVSVDFVMLLVTMHWPRDVRRENGIDGWDFNNETESHPMYRKISKHIMRERGIREITRSAIDPETGERKVETPHELFGYALLLAECRIPMMLVGPSGTGKSHLMGQIADYLELAYGECPMTPGASRGDLLGRNTADGFKSAEFAERYVGGGVFNFEEIDASDPQMLIVTNNAIESDRMFNPASGKTLIRHADNILGSTANTLGTGATREYQRERLDGATRDRWRLGRVWLTTDRNLEKKILRDGLERFGGTTYDFS
jgi:hypothetical protein